MKESYEEITSKSVTDYEVAEWEENEKEITLHVCSTCGFISNEIIDHGDCALQDWWELNVKCFEKVECTGDNDAR